VLSARIKGYAEQDPASPPLKQPVFEISPAGFSPILRIAAMREKGLTKIAKSA
jgi:hypothetical protein